MENIGTTKWTQSLVEELIHMLSTTSNTNIHVDIRDKDGCTALMFAARYSKIGSTENTVQMLIEAGANLDLQDKDGWTALMFASRYSSTDSSEKTVKMLIEAGAKHCD